MVRQRLASALIIATLFIISAESVSAETFCVSTSAELQNALTDAASNGEDDEVQVVQGAYIGNFVYASKENHRLSIAGGYFAQCGSRSLDPTNTVVDGNAAGTALVCTAGGLLAPIEIEGLKINNGRASNRDGGGLYVSTLGDVRISSNIISNSYLEGGTGGGAYIRGNNVIVEGSYIFGNESDDKSAESNPGGGVDVWADGQLLFSSNTITSNVLRGQNDHGGGVSAYGYTVVFSKNTIRENSVHWGGGGGCYIGGYEVTVMNNFFNGNYSLWDGGGLSLSGTYSTVKKNTFSNNTTTSNGHGGGGFVFNAPDLLMEGNVVINNKIEQLSGDTTRRRGGGIKLNGERVRLVGNNIEGNSAYAGGGIYTDYIGTIYAANNIIRNNNVSRNGGAIYVSGASATSLLNNALLMNYAENGGAIYIDLLDDNDLLNVYNNIIYGNVAAFGSAIYIDNDGDNNYFSSQVEIFNNNFDQSTSGTYIEIPFTIDPSNLNNENPLFVDPDNDDYHLQSISPCVDRGTNSAPNLPLTDLEGKPRIMNRVVDMGAYEYPGIVSGRAIPGVLQLLLLNSGG